MVVGVLVVAVLVYLISKGVLPWENAPTLSAAYTNLYNSDGVVGTVSDTQGNVISSFKFQPPDRYYTKIDVAGRTIESISTTENVYNRADNDKWVKTANYTGELNDLIITRDQIEKLKTEEKANTKYKKEADITCPNVGGRCSLVRESTDNDKYNLYFISKGSRRLLKVETYFQNKLSNSITFKYEKVTVDTPTDVIDQSLPNSSASNSSSLPPEVLKALEKDLGPQSGTSSAQ